MKRNTLKRSKNEKIVYGVILAIFIIYAAYLIFPFIYALNSSLKINARTFINDPVSISIPMNFDNYINAFIELKLGDVTFINMVSNSVWYAFGGTALSLLSTAMCAYVVARYNFWGKNFLYGLSIVVLIIPIYGALPAKYSMFYDLGMLNSPLFLICMASAFGFNFLIIYSFFSMISWSYAEAAFIDGASDFAVFWKIMVPMALPSMTALGVMSFVGLWNDYETPILFLSETPPLAAGLWAYEKKIIYSANQPVYFAGVIISLLPVSLIFGTFQNTIMQNVYAGGLKS